jgi:hypothetical protein
MSKTVDSLYILYNTPFLLSGVIVEFFNNYTTAQKNDILLSYLVLPLALYESSKKGLQRANKQRTIRTFIKDPERLYGLADRLEEYKRTTNLALQYALDQHYLYINESLSVVVNQEIRPEINPGLKPGLTAAANLAKMLNDIDVVSVYRQLGIKRL